MKKKIIVGLFLSLALVQIAVPLAMIVKREVVLRTGRQFKFKTVPVDPYDAFRGRYVSLRLESGYVLTKNRMNWRTPQPLYALIDVDDEGFARFTALTDTLPQDGPYLRTRVWYTAGERAYLDLSLQRYYMEERAAPVAEKIYRQRNQGGKKDAYITVRIKDGFAVIEGLYVGGRRIEDVVKDVKKR